ncbi:MAG: 4-alpha-glucanotransferase, partial [Candidatus Competibacteraceae bacterium]|nr:4-alpha-glucanotransferase [Candidatus Competibacteraceae bacterium]
GYGDSPYQTTSACAGNPLLISPEWLAQDGWLDQQDLDSAPDFPLDTVDYGWAIPWKRELLARARHNFQQRANDDQRAEFDAFCRHHGHWLDDFTLFAALKERHQCPWTSWDPALVARDRAALQQARWELAQSVSDHEFIQFQFFRQWTRLRHHAHGRGVRLVGDVPIFVAHDSADVWAHPQWFYLDAAGQPTVVAGVPPDYFSATGQLWGNPLYRWDVLAGQGYSFWVERLRLLHSLVDWIRLDHFRGFAAHWEVPADHPTAMHGHWAPGPGRALFEALEQALGGLPLIAEDLGTITPDVYELRDGLGLPGMAVLQFAFAVEETGYGDSPYLPHKHVQNLVVYTGTHDNDTTVGWWQGVSEAERHFLRRYLATDAGAVHWDFIRTALASVADMAILPLQDVLGLGPEACLNRPGQPGGNWTWRYRQEALTGELAGRLRDMTLLYGRRPV